MLLIKIALYGDKSLCRFQLDPVIRSYFSRYHTSLQINWYSDHKHLPDALAQYSILFLDPEYSDGQGIEIARIAAKNSPNTTLVFIASGPDHAVEAFSLNAVHYLVKPLTDKSVCAALDRCLNRLNIRHIDFLEIQSSSAFLPIPQDTIIYIEVQNKTCTISTEKGTYQIRASLDSLFSKLNHSVFFKPQRSYIVNMKFISSFRFDRITLHSGKEIALSRNNRKSLKQQYQTFLFEQAKREG